MTADLVKALREQARFERGRHPTDAVLREAADRLAAAERDLSAIFKAWNEGKTLEEIGKVVNGIALARSEKAYFAERCGHEWTDDIAQRRCDLPKDHTSGAHDWHSQNLNSAKEGTNGKG